MDMSVKKNKNITSFVGKYIGQLFWGIFIELQILLFINQNKTRPMLVKNQNLIMMGDKALKS